MDNTMGILIQKRGQKLSPESRLGRKWGAKMELQVGTNRVVNKNDNKNDVEKSVS